MVSDLVDPLCSNPHAEKNTRRSQIKNTTGSYDFVDFHKAFDSIHGEKLMEILKAYGIPLETVNAISLLYKNTTAKVISPDGATSFFPIHAEVLQEDALASYLFIRAVDYAMRTAISNSADCGFTLEKTKNRRHPALCKQT